MSKSKIFLIVMLCMVALGLICIGVGYLLGGDFSAIFAEILGDLYGLLEGTIVAPPTVG